MYRRRFLAAAGGGVGAVASGVAVDNVLVGYGRLTGTNVVDQDLRPLVDERLDPADGRTLDVDGVEIRLRPDAIDVEGETVPWSAPRDDLATVEDEQGLADGVLVALRDDLGNLRVGRYGLEPMELDAFLDRAASREVRPSTVEALRGPAFGTAPAEVVREFTGAPPDDVEALVEGLVAGFREHAFYDAPRYTAGAIEDNVLRGAVDLREPFESPADFEAIREGDSHGLFCYDLSFRAIESLHAVPASEQSHPVVAFHVGDRRHKHAYTGLATVLAGAVRPTLALTFLDYTSTTMYHDFGLAWARGDDPGAYDTWHRTTGIFWNQEINF